MFEKLRVAVLLERPSSAAFAGEEHRVVRHHLGEVRVERSRVRDRRSVGESGARIGPLVTRVAGEYARRRRRS